MIEININPVLFTLGSFEFRWYGLMVLLAIVVVVIWGIRAARKVEMSPDHVITAAIIGIPSGYVISRLIHVFDQLDYYIVNPGSILGFEGLTIYGAVLGAALGIFVYSRFSKIPYARFADALAPGIILAQAVGRVGCTINGCCYGLESNLPWAFVYTHPNSYAPLWVGTHPEVVYELIMDLAIFGMLLAIRGRFKIFKTNGALFAFYLGIYSLGRFFLDFLRPPDIAGLHQAQVIALIVMAVTASYLVISSRRAKRLASGEGVEASASGEGVPSQTDA